MGWLADLIGAVTKTEHQNSIGEVKDLIREHSMIPGPQGPAGRDGRDGLQGPQGPMAVYHDEEPSGPEGPMVAEEALNRKFEGIDESLANIHSEIEKLKVVVDDNDKSIKGLDNWNDHQDADRVALWDKAKAADDSAEKALKKLEEHICILS